MQNSNALMVIRRKEKKKSKRISKFIFDEENYANPFHEFVVKLMKKYRVKESNNQEVEFIDFPLQQALISGLWLVIKKVASDNKMTILKRSESSLLEYYINRLINLGLLLKYNSIDNAVEDFDKTVVQKAFADPKKTQGALSSLIQLPVGSFFYSLIKIATQRVKHMREFVNELSWKKNQMKLVFIDLDGLERCVSHFCFNERPKKAHNNAGHFIPPANDEGYRGIDIYKMYSFLNFTDEKIEDSIKELTRILSLPYDLKKVFELTDRYSFFLEEDWINTQILLSVLGKDNKDEFIFDYDAFPTFLKLCYTLDPKKHTQEEIKYRTLIVVYSFIQRMLKMGMKISSEDKVWWINKIKTRIERMVFIFWKEKNEGKKKYTLPFLIYKLTGLDMEKADSLSALKYATGQDDPFFTSKMLDKLKKKTQKERDAFYKEIIHLIGWEGLGSGHVHDMIQAGLVPVSYLAKGVARMQNDSGFKAAKMLFKTGLVDEDGWSELFEIDGLLDFSDPNFIIDFYKYFSRGILNKFESISVEIFSGYWKLSEDQRIDFFDALVRISLKIKSAGIVGNAFSNIFNREVSVFCVFEIMNKKTSLSDKEIKQFVKNFNFPNSWTIMTLAYEVLGRRNTYQYGKDNIDNIYMHPWTQMAYKGASMFDLKKMLFPYLGNISDDELFKTLSLKAHSEEEVFEWLFVVDDTTEPIKKRLKKYLQLRDKYYSEVELKENKN
jgi:hypothetical protein